MYPTNYIKTSLIAFLLLFFSFTATQGQDTILTLKKIVLPEKIRNLSYLISPIVAFNPETSFIFGGVAIVRLKQKVDSADLEFHRPSTILPSVRYTFNRQMIVSVESDIYLKHSANIHIYPRYALYPDVFFGTGNKTFDYDKEGYVDESYNITANISGIFFKKEFIGLVLDFKHRDLYNFEPEKTLDKMQIPGKSGGFHAGAGISIRHDTRDDIFYPTKGHFIKFEAVVYPETGFNKYHFNNFMVDYRYLCSIINTKNIIAYQAFFNSTDGSIVPFYELKKIGGDAALRGIHARRYIDKHAFYMQAEYRRFLFWRFNGVVFCGLGDVAARIPEFSIKTLKYNYGLGLRYKLLKDEKINLRFDIGFSSDKQFGIYIEAKESF